MTAASGAVAVVCGELWDPVGASTRVPDAREVTLLSTGAGARLQPATPLTRMVRRRSTVRIRRLPLFSNDVVVWYCRRVRRGGRKEGGSMYSSVRDIFPNFSKQFEGRVGWMYLDVKGLVTIGVGNLIDPLPAAVGLPFVHRADE